MSDLDDFLIKVGVDSKGLAGELAAVEAQFSALSAKVKNMDLSTLGGSRATANMSKLAAASDKTRTTMANLAVAQGKVAESEEKISSSQARSAQTQASRTAAGEANIKALRSQNKALSDQASGMTQVEAAEKRLARAQKELLSAQNQHNALSGGSNVNAQAASTARLTGALKEQQSAEIALARAHAQQASQARVAAAAQRQLATNVSAYKRALSSTMNIGDISGLGAVNAAISRLNNAKSGLASAHTATNAAYASGDLDAQVAATGRLARAQREMSSAMSEANGVVNAQKNSFASSRYVLQDASRAYAGIGAVALGSVAGIAYFGASYEESWAQVKRVTVDNAGTTKKQLADLRKGLIDLSTQMPVTFQGLSQIAQAGAQMGVPTKALVGFTKATAEFANTTGVTDDVAANYFGRITQNMHLISDSTSAAGALKVYKSLGSAILKVGTVSTASDKEVAEYAQQLSVTGRSAGMSAQQLVGLSGTLASLKATSDPSSGVTALQNTFSKFSQVVGAGGKDLDKFAKVAGMSSQQFKTLWSTATDSNKPVSETSAAWSQLFGNFEQGLGKSKNIDQTLRDLGITNVRQVRTLKALADNQGLYNRLMDDSSSSYAKGTEMQNQYGETSATLKSKLIELGNTFGAIADSLYNNGIESGLKGVVSVVADVAKGINSFINTPFGKTVASWGIQTAVLVGTFALAKAAAAKMKSGIIGIASASSRLRDADIRWGTLTKTLFGSAGAADKVTAAMERATAATQELNSTSAIGGTSGVIASKATPKEPVAPVVTSTKASSGTNALKAAEADAASTSFVKVGSAAEEAEGKVSGASSKMLTAAKTAGSGMANGLGKFSDFLWGPWGLAIGVAGITLASGLSYMESQSQKTAGNITKYMNEIENAGTNASSAYKDFTTNFAPQDNWVNSLNGTSKEFKDASTSAKNFNEFVRQTKAQTQQASKILTADYGPSIDSMTTKQAKSATQMTAQNKAIKKFSDGLSKLSNSKLSDALSTNDINLDTFKYMLEQSPKLAEHMAELAKQSGQAATAANEFSIATGNSGVGLETAGQKANSVTTAMAGLQQAESDAADAAARVASEVKNNSDLWDKNANGINIYTQAGRDALSALNSLQDSASQNISTMQSQGATVDQVSQSWLSARNSYIQSAEQMGFTRDQAIQLANQVFGMQNLGITIATSAPGAVTTIGEVDGVTTALTNVPGETVPRIYQQGADGTIQQVTDVQTQITILDHMIANPNVYVDPGQAVTALNQINRELDHANRTVTSNIIIKRSEMSDTNGAASGNGRMGTLATGGPITGPGGPTDDLAGLYRLSDGEYVLNSATVRAMGGFAGVNSMVRNLGTYRTNPSFNGFASGGGVNQAPTQPYRTIVNVPSLSGIVELGPATINQLARKVTKIQLEQKTIATATTQSYERSNRAGAF